VSGTRTPRPGDVPKRIVWLLNGFKRYVRRFIRKNFHAVRLSKTSCPWPTGPEPILVVLNHPSWWDPMMAVVISDHVPPGEHFGAIDAEAVRKYPVFLKLGFLPVDTLSLRGAAEFLRRSEAILAEPNRLLWLTAQGKFTDVRTRPLVLRPGVGHLAARLKRGRIVPVALEYSFWTEKTPEALIRFGRTLDIADFPERNPKEWTFEIERALTETLDGLNTETMTREPDSFTVLASGRTGVGGAYDRFRRVASWARGRRFDASHAGGESA